MRYPAVLPVLIRARGPGGRAGRRRLRQSRPAGVLGRRLDRRRLLGLHPLVLDRAGDAPGAPRRRRAPRRRDLRRAAASGHIGHGRGAHRLPGRRRRDDLRARGYGQRDAGRRPRRRPARAHRARRGAAGRVGRQRLAHHARRRHRDQQRRLGRADQGRYVGDGHALAPGRQRARRLHGDEPGRGHDAQLARRSAATARTASSTTATASASTAPAATSSTTRSPTTATASASSTASTPARRPTATPSPGNAIGNNAGADIKAAGGPGVVEDNRLTSSMFGLVVSDNPAFVTVQYNLIQGRFQHGILITTGSDAPRACACGTTRCSRPAARPRAATPRRSSSSAPPQVDSRNNLFAYTNPDLLGSAFLLNDASLVGSLRRRHQLVREPRSERVARGLERRARVVRELACALGPGRHERQLGAAVVQRRRPGDVGQPRRGEGRRRSASTTISWARHCPRWRPTSSAFQRMT